MGNDVGETRALVATTAMDFRPWEYLWEMDYREEGKSEVLAILCADLRRFWAGDKQSVYCSGLKLGQFRRYPRAESSGARPGCSATHSAEKMRFEGCAVPVAVGALLMPLLPVVRSGQSHVSEHPQRVTRP